MLLTCCAAFLFMGTDSLLGTSAHQLVLYTYPHRENTHPDKSDASSDVLWSLIPTAPTHTLVTVKLHCNKTLLECLP